MDLKGRKVLVVGMARTGLATVNFLRSRGALVTATESRRKDDMMEAAAALDAWDVQAEWGGHRVETLLESELIVVSPGVDLNIGPLQEALKRGKKIIGEIELAYHFIDGPILAVTGTNGKTTTTRLLGEMLKEEGLHVGVGGNVGEPLILFAEGGPWDALVVEISSFQLETIEAFRPRFTLFLNITEDHLDRYPRYEDYIEAKVRIFQNQTAEDTAILNKDDPLVVRHGRKAKAKKVFFSLQESLEEGSFLDGKRMVLKVGGREEDYSLAEARLKGIHNVENMMASLTAARLFGCSKKAVESTLRRFKGLAHRVELVGEVEGVRYYDDSKGTNVGSVVKSLQSFSEPVILIAGGKDKNGDLSPLHPLIRSRVKQLILIGEAKERMRRELGGLTETTTAKTLEEAVSLARQKARRGEVVLLSPACSSFDMFKDYKERGRFFKEAVLRMEKKN